MSTLSLTGMVRRWREFLIETEVWGRKLKIEHVLSPGKVQGTFLWGEARALLQEIGDVVSGKGTVLQGVSQRAGHGLLWRDLASGDDLAHMMVGVEAALFELAVGEFGLR
jgi:hypothetical protein